MMPDAMKKKKILEEIEYGPIQENELVLLSDLISGMRSYDSDSIEIRSTSREYYHWMYYRNPAGRAIVYRAKHGDNIASSFAMAPKKFQVGSKIITCGKTMDMFTHPDYQGLGLIKKVTELVFNTARDAGINMWYVTPSVIAYPIFLNKWDYKECFQLIYRANVLRISSILEKKIKPVFFGKIVGWIGDFILSINRGFSSLANGYEVQEENGFGPETDELWKCQINTK